MDLWISIGVFIGSILLITVFRSQFKGDIGELVVARFIKGLDKEKYYKLHDIKLKNPSSNTKTTQIDHIVISTYGIFCIETKAYKGKIYGKEFSNKWVQYLKGQKNYFMNPLFQNYAHIKAIESLIESQYPNMVFHSIIAFSPEADIRDIEVKNAKVCKMSEISEVIKSLSISEIISEEDIKIIAKILQSNKSYQSDFSHTRDINKLRKENEKKISENICPKCGGTLVEREGKYGKFRGCSNYPKCRFVVDSKNS